MSDRIGRFLAAARRRLSLLRRRMRSRVWRFFRAWGYAMKRLSAEDAQTMLQECECAAGWHALLTLGAEDVLAHARERFEEHPALPLLVSQACARVAYKWEQSDDHLHHAQSWAMELVEEWATDMGLDLVVRSPCAPDDDAEDAL